MPWIGLIFFLSLFFSPLCIAKAKKARRYALANRPVVHSVEKKRSKRWFVYVPAYFRVYGGLSFSYADAQSAGTAPTGATRNAIALGAWIEQPINDVFAVELGLAYVQRGVQTEVYQLGDTPLQGTVVINSLEVPFRLRARLLKRRRWRLFAAAGLSAGVTMQREATVLGLVTVNLNDRFETADFLASLSVGVDYRVARDLKVTVELKNDFGLVDIDQSDAVYRTRGHQILFGLGWAFQ